ncbi:MAG: flagellar FliJ family protein [Thermoguttaceae bacterium]|nr:flagellar FliJ family protein [Thermoguttaceae bacterium]
MAFHFRLRTVQKVQELKRDEKKQTLAELLQKQNELHEKMASIREKIARTRSERAQRMSGKMLSMDQLRQFHQFECRLEQNLAELQKEEGRLHLLIETQQSTLLESEQEVKKFEKLEEKQREQYRKTHERSWIPPAPMQNFDS